MYIKDIRLFALITLTGILMAAQIWKTANSLTVFVGKDKTGKKEKVKLKLPVLQLFAIILVMFFSFPLMGVQIAKTLWYLVAFLLFFAVAATLAKSIVQKILSSFRSKTTRIKK